MPDGQPFIGAPLINEPPEVGFKKAPIYSTERDAFKYALPAAGVAAIIAGVLIHTLVGVAVLFIGFIALVVVFSVLREKYGGHHWDWEVIRQVWSTLAKKGYLNRHQKNMLAPSGRRSWSPAVVPGTARFRSGEARDLAPITTSERYKGGAAGRLPPFPLSITSVVRQDVAWPETSDQINDCRQSSIEPWMLSADLPTPRLPLLVTSTASDGSGPRYRRHLNVADSSLWHGGMVILAGTITLLAILVILISVLIWNSSTYLHPDVRTSTPARLEW